MSYNHGCYSSYIIRVEDTSQASKLNVVWLDNDVTLWMNLGLGRGLGHGRWAISDPACTAPAAWGNVNLGTFDIGSLQLQLGQHVSNAVCNNGGQQCSEQGYIARGGGQK